MSLKGWMAGFLMVLAGTAAFAGPTAAAGKEETKTEDQEEADTVDVLFLQDTHSHLKEFVTVEEGIPRTMGGFARIKTLILEQKEKNPETLLLDAGDFSMGTLIQTVFSETAAEIRMLGELGFDATTLGNHEFDYRSAGLAGMLTQAAKSGDPLPELVLCNVDWEEMEEAGLTPDQQLLKDAFEYYGVQDYIITEKNGIKIAVTGVFGKDSLECAPTCVLEFEDPVEAVKETVEQIQEKEEADLIVCVSHSGTQAAESKSEDEILAKRVPQLDLIISGHSHTKLETPIVHGETVIVSAGEYGKYLGSLSLSRKENGRWETASYELLPVTDAIEPEKKTQEKVEELMERVDTEYLQQFGYTKDQILCTNEIAFAEVDDLYEQHTEQNLGSILADGYINAAEAVSSDPHPVDVAVVPSGTVRDTYAPGAITVEDVFNSCSLGIGEDLIPGYPLISVYLTGKELKTVAEIDASISDLMPAARLYTGGLCWSYHPKRMILNKTTDVWLQDKEGQRVELEDDRLYRLVTDYYSSQMLSSVTKLSYGLLSIVPKTAEGVPVADFSEAILMDGSKELKAWAAIAGYMETFEDTDGDGRGNIPERYGTKEGRKVVETGGSLPDLLRKPNRFFFLILAVGFVVLLLAAFLILLLIRLIRFCIGRRKQRTW